MSAVDEQRGAALAETRQIVDRVVPGPGQLPAGGQLAPWSQAIISRYKSAPRCLHLDERPLQPWLLTGFVGIWLCRACTTSPVGLALGQDVDPVEEITCDVCREQSPDGRLTRAVITADVLLITVYLCDRCVQIADAQGAHRR